jgi:hypothetical protein
VEWIRRIEQGCSQLADDIERANDKIATIVELCDGLQRSAGEMYGRLDQGRSYTDANRKDG